MFVLFFLYALFVIFFFFQAEDGIRDGHVTGVQTCALPIYGACDGRSSDTPAPNSDVIASTHRAVCMLWMKGASFASESPFVRPEKISSSTGLGTAAVTIASTNAIEITAPVF